MSFWSIIWFTHLGLKPSILTTIREENILICSVWCFGKRGCKYLNIDGSGAGITNKHDQLGMHISTNKIESPPGISIPVIKGNQTSIKYHVATIFVDNFS